MVLSRSHCKKKTASRGRGGFVQKFVSPIFLILKLKPSFRYCATWARDGECQANPGWMLKNCPVSCKECKNKCADHEVYCNEWKAEGECKKNPEYMNIYCAKSCGKCKAKGNCKDENDYCQAWAQKGYCTKGNHVNYMKLRCKKACGKC